PIENDPPVAISRSTTGRLNEGSMRAKIAFFIRVQNRDEAHLGQVQPFSQQIDSDKDIKHSASQIPHNLCALERLDIGVKVSNLQAQLVIVFGQILRHSLRERRDEYAPSP